MRWRSAVALALVAPGAAQAFSLAPSVTLTGTYTLVHVDGDPGHPDRDAYRPVLRVGNRAYDVALGKGMAFRSGDTVRFGGRLDGRTLRASSAHIQSFVSDHAPVAGTTKVLVILAEWAGQDSHDRRQGDHASSTRTTRGSSRRRTATSA